MTLDLLRGNLFCFSICAGVKAQEHATTGDFPPDLIKYFEYLLSSQIFPEGRSCRGWMCLKSTLFISFFSPSFPTVFSQTICVANERFNPGCYASSFYLCITIHKLVKLLLRRIDSEWKFIAKGYGSNNTSNWYLFCRKISLAPHAIFFCKINPNLFYLKEVRLFIKSK